MKTVRCVLLVLVLLLLALPASALTKGFETLSFRPTADEGPYLGLWGSRAYRQFEWSIGTTLAYAYRPMQLTTNGSRVQGILDQTFVQHMNGAVGIVDRWLEAGFDMPMGWYVRYQNPNIVGSTMETKIARGDLRIFLKSQLVDHQYFGLALVPFISAPTGQGEYFFGAGGVTGGGIVVMEGKPHERVKLALNAGVNARSRFDFRDIEKSNQMLLGAGLSVRATDSLSVASEINTSTRLSGPFSEKNESPAEALVGLKYGKEEGGLSADLGGGMGILKGSGAPTFRVLAGIGYRGKIERREHAAPVVAAPELPKELQILYGFNGYRVSDAHAAVIIQVAEWMVNAPEAKLKVTGYTDTVGGVKVNERVSRVRAEMVKALLVQRGMDAGRIEAVGRGQSDPIGDNATTEGRAKNRRVTFELMR